MEETVYRIGKGIVNKSGEDTITGKWKSLNIGKHQREGFASAER